MDRGKRFNPEQTITKLRQIEVRLAQGYKARPCL